MENTLFFCSRGRKKIAVLVEDDFLVETAKNLKIAGLMEMAVHKSNMIVMIGQLRIGTDLRPPKCSSNKSYERNEANQPRYTDVEFANLTPENREFSEEQNHKNMMPQQAIED